MTPLDFRYVRRFVVLASLCLAPAASAQSWNVVNGSLTFGGGAGFNYSGTFPSTSYSYTGTPPTYVAYVFVRPDGSEKGWSGPIGGSPGNTVAASAQENWDQYGTWTVQFWYLQNTAQGVFARTSLVSTYQFTIGQPAQPPTVSISARPTSLRWDAGPVTITWLSMNADTVVSTSGITTSSVSGSFSDTLPGNNSTTNDVSYTYSITVRGAGGTASASTTVTVSKKELTPVIFDFRPPSFTYDGSAHAPTIVASPSAATWQVTGGTTTATAPGTYSFTVQGTGDYTGSATCNWMIEPKPVTFSFSNTSQVYDGSIKSANVSCSDPAAMAGATVNVSSSSANVGSYAISASANGNYTGSGSDTLTIVPKPVTFTFTNLTYTYDGLPKSATVTCSDPNAPFTSDLTKGPAQGTYTVSATATGNYTGSGTATLVINSPPPPQSVSATISVSPGTSAAPGSTTVVWSTHNADSVSVSGPGMSTNTSSSGAQTITGLGVGTYLYTITADGNGGPVAQTATFTVTAAPNVSVSLSASPSGVTAPGSTTITWSSSNATSVAVSGPNLTPSTAASGSQSITGLAAGTYTYTITAQGNGGPVTQTATVTVTNPIGNVSAILDANPTNTSAPGQSTITWSTTNASAVSVSGPNLTTSTAPSGSQTVMGLAVGTHTYAITASGNGGPITRTVTVTVSNPSSAATAVLTVDKTTATTNDVIIMAWKTANCTSWSLTGTKPVPGYATWSGTNGSTGSQAFSNMGAGTYSYTLAAKDGSGATVTSSVTFTVADPNTVGASISAVPSVTVVGQPVTVYWNTANATTANVSGSMITATTLSGNATTSILPAGIHTYTIDAYGPSGHASATAMVIVSAGAGASISGSESPNPVAYTGAPATLSGSSWGGAVNNANAIIQRRNFGLDGSEMPPTSVDSIGGFPINNSEDGANTWFSWNVPPNTTGRAVWWQALVAGGPGTPGGTATIQWTQEANPSILPQNLTVSLQKTQLVPGETARVNVAGNVLPLLWSTNVSVGTGGSAYFTAPNAAKPGDVFIVTAYAPAGTVAGQQYAASNLAGATFTITDTPTITWAAPAAITYGTALSTTQLDATANLPGTFAYAPAAGEVPPAGTLTLRTTFTPNDSSYQNATKSVPLLINKAPLTVRANDVSREFGAANPQLTMSYSGLVNGDSGSTALSSQPTLSTTATVASPVGTYPISISGGTSSNYLPTLTAGTLTVTPAPVTFATPGNINVSYDGTAKSVSVTPSVSSATYTLVYAGTGSTSYPPSPAAPSLAGSYLYTATATGNFSGTATGTLTIAKAVPTLSWAAPAPISYGTLLGGAQLNASADAPGAFVYTPAAGTVVGAGTQMLSVTFTPNDTANFTSATAAVALNVNRATLTVTAVDATRIYGQANPSFTVRYAGFVKGDSSASLARTPEATTPATAASPIGSYSIVPAGGSSTNYAFVYVPGTLTISPAPVSFNIAAPGENDAPATYNGAPQAVRVTPSDPNATYSVSYRGSGSTTYGPTATPPTNAGDYGATVVATGNYVGSATSGFTVVTATPALAWASPAAITYGVPLGATQLNATTTVPGTFTYSPSFGTVLGAGIQTLATTFTPADTTNFRSANATVVLTVNPAALTIVANDATRVFGAPNPAFSVSYTGFVPGDTESSITAPAITTTATPASPVGTYPIVLSGGAATNYVLTRVNGSLTVTPKPVTFTIAGESVTYDGAPKPITVVPSDHAATYTLGYSGTGSTSYATSTAAPTNAGSYVYTITANGNYSGFASGVLTIAKSAPVITWPNPAAIPYGTALGALQLNASASVAGGFTYSPAAGVVLGAGTHTLTATFTPADAVNYSPADVSASLTVTRKPVGFTFANLAWTYDGSLKTATVSASDAAATYDADLTKGPDAGNYLVSATAKGDYVGTGSAMLTISPAPQTVILTPATVTTAAGEPVTLSATGGHNAYTWSGLPNSPSGASATAVFSTPGECTVSVSNNSGPNYLASNVATALVTVIANRTVTRFNPVQSDYTVTDANSPMHGKTYGRIWQSGGAWTAYLGRAGVKFEAAVQAWPAVQELELQARAPGADWKMLASQTVGNGTTTTTQTFEVTLGETVPGQPLVPLSFQQGAPLTGEWRFRARVRNTNGEWSDFSAEVPVQVVLPMITKTLSGQTVPPAGELGAWFTASPVQTYTFPLWIP